MRWSFETPTAAVRMRIHGAQRELTERSTAAYIKALSTETHPMEAASLRGKAHAYAEAAAVLAAIEDGRRIPKRRRWTGWSPERARGAK